MKKRTDAESIKQSLSSDKTLLNSQFPRKYKKYKSLQAKKVFSRSLIPAPSSISFFEKDYDEFSAFLNKLKKLARHGRILIDLKPVKHVKAAGLLVLYANIEQLQKEHEDLAIIKTTGCKLKEVSMFFRTFGIWGLTGESRIRPTKVFRDSLEVTTMTHAQKMSNDKRGLRKILEYAQTSAKNAGMHEGKLMAYNAITESISNVWQHAYDDEFFDPPLQEHMRNWWIIAQRIDDQFFIAMYDMGAGIPATISKKNWAPALLEVISKMLDKKFKMFVFSDDAKSIKAAVDYGKSRFKQDNRGKGLTEAKDFVQRNPEGSMLIFSGLGHYEYKTDGDDESLHNLNSNFNGTLIQWNLKLENKDAA